MRVPLATLSLSAFVPAPSPSRSPRKPRSTMPSPLNSTSNTPARSAGPLQTLFEAPLAPPSPARSPMVAASPARRMLERDELEVTEDADDDERAQPTPPRRLLDMFMGVKSPASAQGSSPSAALGGPSSRRDEAGDTPAWTFYEDQTNDAIPQPANAFIELNDNEDTDMADGDTEPLPASNENAPPPLAPRTLASRRLRSASSNSLAPNQWSALPTTLSPRARSTSALPSPQRPPVPSEPGPEVPSMGAEVTSTTPTSPPLFPSLFPAMPSPPLLSSHSLFADGGAVSFDQPRTGSDLLPAFGAIFTSPRRKKRVSGGGGDGVEAEVEQGGHDQKRLRMSLGKE